MRAVRRGRSCEGGGDQPGAGSVGAGESGGEGDCGDFKGVGITERQILTRSDTVRLYHFTSCEYALDDLKRRRLKIAQIGDLNDPFELLLCAPTGDLGEVAEGECLDMQPAAIDAGLEKFKTDFADEAGVVCFTRRWNEMLMWAHYADSHRGICLGFDVTGPERKFGPVCYSDERIVLPRCMKDLDEHFMSRVLHSKSEVWRHEQEWRVFTDLKTPEWNSAAGRFLYFVDFGKDLFLREVILGVNCKVRENEVGAMLDAPEVDVRRVKLSKDSYKLL